MSNTHYRAFLQSSIELARSMVIKSVAIEHALNEVERSLGRFVSTDPHTWVYYRHLAGEYTDFDQPMRVLSFDTSEEISFDCETLKKHPATRNHYGVGQAQYRRLLERYPNQELLIRGILQPVDKESAIEATDFQLLAYDATLVEQNEHSLIDHIQTRLNEFRVRWDNPAYNLNDDLYSTASLAVLYGRLPGWILNHRLACCKTREAHSFHMKEYLKSHGRLDRYFDYLTIEQKLWLYRNVLYIERNAGKQHTFDWIAHHLLTKRGLGYGAYHLKHNIVGLSENTDLKPKPEGYLTLLNAFHRNDQKQENTIAELLRKQRSLARNNKREEPKALSTEYAAMQNTRRASLPTKALESATIDWSESGTLYRSSFLINHWLYYSAHGFYRTNITLYHPRDNTQFELSTEEAFVLFLYAYNRSIGVVLETIPRLTAHAIRRYPVPSFDTLSTLVEIDDIDPLNTDRIYTHEVDYVADQPFYREILQTRDSFVNTVTQYYYTFEKQREFYGFEEQHRRRAQKQALMDHLYMSVDTAFSMTGQSYSTWLDHIKFYPTDLRASEYEQVATSLLAEATGIGYDDDNHLASIQKAMLDIIDQLSSYSIHFIQQINYGPILFWEWPAFRPGEFYGSAGSGLLVKIIPPIPRDASFKGFFGYYHDINRVVQRDYSLKGFISVDLGHQPIFYTIDHRRDSMRLPLARTWFQSLEITEID